MDILRFFIGVMTLLTLFVAGFAGYNWSKAEALREEVALAEVNYDRTKKMAGAVEFRRNVAKDRELKDFDQASTEKFSQFLSTMATRMNIIPKEIRPEGAPGGSIRGNYIRVSYNVVLERQPLAGVIEYLYRLQLEWPGLKIEQLTVQEVVKGKEDFEGWNVTALVSTFRPK
jgi:hypothetical protein